MGLAEVINDAFAIFMHGLLLYPPNWASKDKVVLQESVG